MAGDDVAGKQRCDCCVNFRPLWRITDFVFVDPVDVHVNRIKIILRVYKLLPGLFWHSVAERRDPNLADAGEVRIGGFNIEDDEVH
jgi:hypothetical protein